jgi:hypothetical protein
MQARTRFFPQVERYDRDGVDKGPMNADCAWYRKEAFQEVIHREAVRSSRSGRSFLLLLFDVSVCGSTEMTQSIISVLSSSTREIDVKGWYKDGAIMGILFTELGRMHNSVDAASEAIIGRLYGSLSGILSNEDMLRMKITPYPLSREAYASNAQRVGGPGSI